MAERNSHDRIKVRYGKCLGDNCINRKNGEIIEIPARKEFVCPECGKPLRECPPPKKKNKSLFFIIGGIVIALIVAAIILFAPGTDEKRIVEDQEYAISGADSIGAEQTHEEIKDEPVEEIRPISKEDSIETTSSSQNPENQEAVKKQIPTKVSSASAGTHQLSYGNWTGGWRNGQPHGTGTLTYTVSHLIDSRDSKGRVAQPGEYIVGEWDNGHLVQGRWFKNDGTKEAVIIGKAG